MKFTIKARATGAALFTVELDASYESRLEPERLGAATKEAHKAKVNLGGANLLGADLYGANLGGANLGECLKASGPRPLITLGPVGKNAEYIYAFITSSGVHVRSAHFTGALSDFRAQLMANNKRDADLLVWIAAIHLIEAHALAYPADEKESAA